LSERIFRIQACLLEIRQEGLAASAHAFDDGRLDRQRKLMLVWLREASNQQDAVIPRDYEDDLIRVMKCIGSGRQGVV